MMKLYVIRHGETDINVQYRINALNDDDLNAHGVEQAKNVRKELEKKQIDYDFIICSPLIRTKHTAELLNYKNVPIIYDERIVERGAGVLTKASLVNIDENDWWSIHPKANYYDAETVENVLKRVYDFLDDIKQKYANNNVILVTHGGTSKAITAYFKGVPKDGILERYKHDNCEIKLYEL